MKIFPCLLVLLTVTAHAQIYKWKSEDGRTIYGDAPPPGNTSAEKITLPDPAPSGTLAPEKKTDWQTQEREFQKRRLSRAKAQIEADKAEEKRKRSCASLKQEKLFLQRVHGRRIARWNHEKGDYDYLTDEDRASAEKRLNEHLEQFLCEE